MKTTKYLILISFAVLSLLGCEEYVDERIDFSNQYGPFVAYHDYDVYKLVEVTENDDAVNYRVNVSPDLYEDVIVKFKMEGDAVYGTDFMVTEHVDEDENVAFTVSNASDNGFELTIPYDIDWSDADRSFFEIQPLTDGISDGNKQLDIIMESAETSSGVVLHTGRIDEQDTITIIFSDVDCPSDLGGTYTATFGGFLDGIVTDLVLTEQAINGVYDMDDFAGLAFGEPVPATFNDACGAISGTVQLDTPATIIGIVNEDGSIDLEVTYATYFWTIHLVKQ
ncbi:MAG: hypothetical protein JW798_07450 [Prolixibacteraceae bacterium]|nr:hypothetical protein [Prolixibacteraceae bacterium]